MKTILRPKGFTVLETIQKNKLLVITAIFIFLTSFYALLYKLYMPHINSFGCFDECMNYLGGYFLLHGRSLYSQIFFNHQPLMAYMSWVVLRFSHPSNMFEILSRYKQFLLLFSFVANFFIIKRFRWAGVGFVIIFELSKYYLFGDKFLAESFIVYPLVYLTGLLFLTITQQKIYLSEYILAGIFAWFVLFSREPFIIASFALLFLILGFGKNFFQKIGYGTFVVLSGITVLSLSLQQYIYQVFIINSQGVGAADAQSTQLFGIGVFKVFLYPLFIFFEGSWNEYRILLIGISFVFCLFSLYFIANKQYKTVFSSWFVLGLVNVRPILPGQLFYSSFHYIPYFGMFLLLTFLFLREVKNKQKYLFYIGSGILFITFLCYVLLSKNFIFYRVNQQAEFVINFGQSYEVGSVIHTLSQPSNTFFIDRADDIDIAYLTSHLSSPYAYSDYGFVAPGYKIYQQAYQHMWQKNSPDFYFGNSLPKSERDTYVVLEKENKPSKIFVKKTLLKTIPNSAWESIKNFGYTKPQHI